MSRIAILGTGEMGSRMARRLEDAGHWVTVWNRNPARAEVLVSERIRAAATPREAVHEVEIAISMVRDDAASKSVWLDRSNGALKGLAEASLAVECSTLSLDWTHTLARHFAKAGRSFIDAPVAGSRPQAEAGQLIFFVGGTPSVCDRFREVSDVLGQKQHDMGEVGAGTAMKLIVNAFFGLQVAAVAELAQFANKMGLRSDAAMSVLAETPLMSPAAQLAAAAMADRAFAPQFPIDLVKKDFGLISETARSVKASMPVTECVDKVYQRAAKNGLGDLNITGVRELYD
ncbi:MAG: NAD(P)-dependent oxidoreductase [Pseudomonadota bacterium]